MKVEKVMGRKPQSRLRSFESAVAPVVTTKLAPPRGNRRMIVRDGLLAQLMESRRKRCLVVQGPAGCGKTAVMAMWRQALLPLDFDVAWLTLAVEDNELTRWLDYLLASVASVAPEITRDAMLLAGRGVDPEAVERTIIALVDGVARYRRDIVLILDDLHLIGDAGIRESLQCLLDYAPDNLHLALVSRSAIPLSLARLRDEGLTLELDLRDLRFSFAETEAFLRAQLGSIERKEAQLLHEMTDGWVAGLQLYCVNWKKKQETSNFPNRELARIHVQDALTFSDYFERQVLSLLTPAELDLLERAAVCQRFTTSLCAALLGRPDATADVATVLAQLENDNVFIVPIDGVGRERWYRLHPLLSEVLRIRLRQRGEQMLHQVHAAAWVWLRDRGHLDEAVKHAVIAGEAEAAAALLEQCAQDMYVRGDLRKLFGLVKMLPTEQVKKSLWLRLWVARTKLYAREWSACRSEIEALRIDIPKGRKQARFALTVLEATLAVLRDSAEEAEALLSDLLNPPKQIHAMALGGRNNILSWLYMQRGEFAKAREAQREANKVEIDGAPLLGTSAGVLLGRCLVGLSHAIEGHMTLAERVYRDVLRQAEQRQSSVDPAYMAAALLGEVLYENNDINGVLKLLEDRVDVLERVSIPDSVLRVLLVLSRSHWLLGRRLEAFAFLERLQDYASNLGLDRLLVMSLMEQMRRYLERDDYDAARTCLQSIDRIAFQTSKTEHGGRGAISMLAQRAHIHWLLGMGHLREASTHIEPLVAAYDTLGRQHMVIRLKLQSAVIDRRLDGTRASGRQLSDVLRHGQRLGLVRSLIDVDPAVMRVINEFVQASEPDPLLERYIERLNAAARSMTLDRVDRSTGIGNYESLSDREKEIVSLLANAMPNKKIARTLCLSPETVKWHLKNIYGKLGVASRDEAVARVRDFKLSGL